MVTVPLGVLTEQFETALEADEAKDGVTKADRSSDLFDRSGMKFFVAKERKTTFIHIHKRHENKKITQHKKKEIKHQ